MYKTPDQSGLVYDDDAHTYTLAGRVIPSVTQILKQVVDFSMVAPDILERKCAIGSVLHMAIALDHADDLDYDSLTHRCCRTSRRGGNSSRIWGAGW